MSAVTKKPDDDAQLERCKVHCRLRPLRPSDDSEANPAVSASSERGKLLFRRESGETVTFGFDSFLGPTAAQDTVYSTVAEPIVDGVLSGYNGTIFAYGQTGSGKTYSMFGPEEEGEETIGRGLAGEDRGIVPRALEQIFNKADRDEAHEYAVRVSYVQIYCEVISDLLCPENSNLSVRERSTAVRPRGARGERCGGAVYIEGASEFIISSASDALHYLRAGEKNRKVATTKMNASSSRSHTCLIVSVEQRDAVADSASEEKISSSTLASAPRVRRGKLLLVDLAGSERVKRAHDSREHHLGARFSESKAINLSLSALGNCISALAERSKKRQRAGGGGSGASQRHIPYRDSRLTRLLQDSLGGSARTALVLNISPCTADEAETASSLGFGQRAGAVAMRPMLNEDVDYRALYESLRSVVDKKDDEVHSLQMTMSKRCLEIEGLRRSCTAAEEARDAAEAEVKAIRATLQSEVVAVRQQVASQRNDGGGGGVFGLTASADEGLAAIEEANAKWMDEIARLRSEHETALQRVRDEYRKEQERSKSNEQSAVTEWNRIEYDLQGEKEEHLSALRALREKQTQLADLERSTSERLGELVEADREKSEQLETMHRRLKLGFEQNKKLVRSNQVLQEKLEEILAANSGNDGSGEEQDGRSQAVGERSLKLIESLVARVEHLEREKATRVNNDHDRNDNGPEDPALRRSRDMLDAITNTASSNHEALRSTRVPAKQQREDRWGHTRDVAGRRSTGLARGTTLPPAVRRGGSNAASSSLSRSTRQSGGRTSTGSILGKF